MSRYNDIYDDNYNDFDPNDYIDETWVICPECGEESRVVSIDFGIGAYEYWGAPGVHVQMCDVTECCEADPTDETD